jgi:hypothetical protein
MKSRHPILQRINTYQTKAQRLLATLALLGTTLTASQSFAADDILFEPTGANSDLLTANGHWQNAWGPAFNFEGNQHGALVFEPTNPPPSGATGGSVYMKGDWTVNNTNGWDCMNTVWRGGWYDAPADNFDGALYEYLVMDVMYDTNSTMVNPSWSIGLDQGWGHTELTNYTFATDGSWQHLVIPIAANKPNIGSTCGVSFYRWLPSGTIGTMGFWVANVQLIARNVPIAPPTTAISEDVVPGLAMFADKLPSYLRGNVRTDTTGAAQVDWVGQASPANPVSYSWTISQFPGPGHANFRSDIVLTPDPVASLQSADPDWSATDALWISIQSLADGSVAAGIAFKTNQPNGNSQMNPGGTGLLTGGHTLAAPTAIGTWTLTFSNNTDMTLTAPSGASTNVSLPADVASTYTGVSFFLITAMGNDGNVGQSATYSALNITGVTTPVNENFTDGVLDTPFLALMNQGYLFPWNLNPPSHRWVTSDARFWLKWSLPDTGFAPVSSPTLPGSAVDWLARGLTNSFLNGNQKWALVNANNLPGPSQGYFALLKRVPTKLQTLLASEVNAPGTVSGKTGTIDPVTTGVNTAVTINSVDPAWFIGGGTVGHMIQLSISPEDPLAIIDDNAALANGTVNILVNFGTPGTYTVTATDVTDGSLTASTSSTITVTSP